MVKQWRLLHQPLCMYSITRPFWYKRSGFHRFLTHAQLMLHVQALNYHSWVWDGNDVTIRRSIYDRTMIFGRWAQRFLLRKAMSVMATSVRVLHITMETPCVRHFMESNLQNIKKALQWFLTTFQLNSSNSDILLKSLNSLLPIPIYL